MATVDIQELAAFAPTIISERRVQSGELLYVTQQMLDGLAEELPCAESGTSPK